MAPAERATINIQCDGQLEVLKMERDLSQIIHDAESRMRTNGSGSSAPPINQGMLWRLCAEACGAEIMCYSTERSVLSSGVRCTKNDQNGSRFTSLLRSSRASDMDRGGTRSQITRSYNFVLQLTVITVINVSEIKRHQKFTVDGLLRVGSETVTSLFKGLLVVCLVNVVRSVV